MMKIKASYIFLLLFAVLLIQWYTIFHLQHVNNRLVKERLSENNNNKWAQIISLDYITSIKTEGYKIPSGTVLRGKGGVSVCLDSLFSDGKKFVICYPVTACQACVEQQIPVINTLAESIGGENIVFISPYTSERFIEIAKKNFSPIFELYLNTVLRTPIEDIAQTAMFIVHEDGTASHVFIPRKELPETTERYLDFIQTLF